MPTVAPSSALAKSGPTYLQERYMAALTKPLDQRHVLFVPLPLTSQLRIESVAYTADGEVGKYKGAHTVGYVKADLTRLLPHPLLYLGAYPSTFGDIATVLRQTYGIILDEGEFQIGVYPDDTPLVNSSVVNWAPNTANDVLVFEALPASIRWQTGTGIRLRIPKVASQVSLPGLISQPQPGTIGQLIDQTLV